MIDRRTTGLRQASAIYAVGLFLAKAAKFLLIPVYVRYLTPAEVGILVFVEALAVVASRVFPLGLGQAIKRFYVEHADRDAGRAYARDVWWAAVAVSTGLGAVSAVAVLLWGSVLTGNIGLGYWLFAIAIGVLQSWFSFTLQFLIADQRPSLYSVMNIAQFVTTAGAVILFVVGFGWGLPGALCAQVLGFAVWALVGGSAVMGGSLPQFNPSTVGPALRYGSLAVPHLFFTWGITFVDRLVLERYVSLDDLGVYGIGYQIASALSVFTLSMVAAWQIRFFKIADTPTAPQHFRRGFVAVIGTVVFLASGLFLFAPEIVAVVATDEYAAAARFIRIVTVGLIFHAVYQVLLLPIFFVKRTDLVSLVTAFGFGTNLVLNLFLVPRYGVEAAAWNTIAAYLVTSAAAYVVSRRSYPVSLDWSALLLAFGTGGVLWSLSGSAAPQLALGPVAMKIGLLVAGGFAYMAHPRLGRDLLANVMPKHQNTPG